MDALENDDVHAEDHNMVMHHLALLSKIVRRPEPSSKCFTPSHHTRVMKFILGQVLLATSDSMNEDDDSDEMSTWQSYAELPAHEQSKVIFNMV